MSYEAQAGCRKSDPKRYQGQLVTGQGTGLLCQDEGSSIHFRDTEEPSPSHYGSTILKVCLGALMYFTSLSRAFSSPLTVMAARASELPAA